MVVGSNDVLPDKKWHYIDLQNIKNRINTKLQKPIVFNVNSTKSYSYYRLIIMEMPPNNSVIRINQWTLNFLPYLSINETKISRQLLNYGLNLDPQSNNTEHFYLKSLFVFFFILSDT
jgi:hypothetical protein